MENQDCIVTLRSEGLSREGDLFALFSCIGIVNVMVHFFCVFFNWMGMFSSSDRLFVFYFFSAPFLSMLIFFLSWMAGEYRFCKWGSVACLSVVVMQYYPGISKIFT